MRGFKRFGVVLAVITMGVWATVFCGGGPAVAAVDPAELEKARTEIAEEFKWLEAEADVTFVVTASRVKEDIRKSAASISVVTADRIREMGARHLMDVLRAVPGMSAWYHGDGHYKIDTRGTSKVIGQDILLMINSHPMNSNFFGGATWTYDTLPVENIERVEVIRGPGSALYGANAFSGVINVITRKADDVDGAEITLGGGSYDTFQSNALFGKYFGDLGVTLNLHYSETDGPERFVGTDSQALSDAQARSLAPLYPPPFSTLLANVDSSQAPKTIQTEEEILDVALNMEFKGLSFDGRFTARERYPGLSAIWTLGEDNVSEPKAYYLNLGYRREIVDNFELSAKVYQNYNEDSNFYRALTGGAVVFTPNDGSLIPVQLAPALPFMLDPETGLVAAPESKNRRTGGELQATYSFGDFNTLVAGFTYEDIEQYDVEYRANFLYTPVPNVIIPLPEVRDLTDIQNFNQDADREFTAFFIQDIWDITDTVRLTVGARYDNYSDFGDSFNPRAGLAWEFLEGYDLKLLYGRAFRAPTFQELYTQNNPSVLGNPDLEPETVDTYEISLGARFTESLTGRVTAFHNTIEENIDLVIDAASGSGTYQNANDLETRGFEVELRYAFLDGGYFGVHYTYQDSENKETGERPINIPKHKGNLMLNVPMGEHLNLYVDTPFLDGFERASPKSGSDDPREDLGGFMLVNLTLIARNFPAGWEGAEFRGSIYNLFDEDYKYPYAATSLPEDLAMEGINAFAEFRFTF